MREGDLFLEVGQHNIKAQAIQRKDRAAAIALPKDALWSSQEVPGRGLVVCSEVARYPTQ